MIRITAEPIDYNNLNNEEFNRLRNNSIEFLNQFLSKNNISFYESSDIDVWYLYDSKVVVIFGNKDARLVETYKVAENVSIFTRCCQAWLAFVFIPDFSYFVKITVVC